MAHIIIGGFGPVGRVVADALSGASVTVSVIDLNRGTYECQRRLGRSILHGDIGDPETLTLAGIHRAAAFVVAAPYSEATPAACRLARSMAPELMIVARVSHLSQAVLAREAGADSVITEELVTADAMASSLVNALVGDGGAGRALSCEGAD